MSTAQTGQSLVNRAGTIANYAVRRAEANFVFTDTDKTRLGAVAVAAGLAGLGGQAVSTASYTASTEEHADYVEFDLDGFPVKGWVWRSPFKEGDSVEVVGELSEGHLEAAAIVRPSDRTIALYPHCSRGRNRHYLNAAKWWLLGTTALLMFCTPLAVLIIGVDTLVRGAREELYVALGLYAFFGVATFSLTRKWMPFVRVSEKIFVALGWTNPSDVDLVKSSRMQRRPDDPGEFGTFYFRY